MRALLAALLATTALPVFADTLIAESTVTAVTVYPDGATVTREVRFTVPSAGAHDLLVTDLPASAGAALMRLSGSEGLDFGAFSLRGDRLPPRAEPLTPEQEAAKAAVTAAEATVRQARSAVEAVQARVSAAEARVAFLTSFSGPLPETATPETLQALADTIGAETLAAHEAAALARADLWPAEAALQEAEAALANAEAAFAALPARDAAYTALVASVEAASAGEQVLTVTHFVPEARWRPFYEVNLTRQGDATVTLDRSVLVTQYTGEDWAGVALTLSTSRPSDQSSPSTLWPELRQIGPEVEDSYRMAEDAMGATAVEPEAVVAAAPIVAVAGMEGDTVVYDYPRAVDVASGVEDLRLALDSLSIPADVTAVAVPRWDATAFVMADFLNTAAEPILPGEALVFREGVLVGGTSLGPIAPGAETSLAFGPNDTLKISRTMPVRDSGETGLILTENAATEEAVLVVENLGTESWPVRVIDQIPYSEQEDLEIELTATPEPTETDLGGQRGILAWEFDLAPGAKTEISLGYSMTWPDGMVLR